MKDKAMRSASLFLLVCLATVTAAFAGTPTPKSYWATKTALPVKRYGHAMTGWGSRAYVFGGTTLTSVYTNTNAIMWFDTLDGAWHNSATALPGNRLLMPAVTARGKIFIVGGDSVWGKATNTLYCYSPDGDSINARAPLPTVACDHQAVVWRDSLIYRLGGGNWHAATPQVSTVEVYNILTNTWSAATPMPTTLGCHGSAIMGDTIVVSCGFITGGSVIIDSTYVGVINPANPTQIAWSRGARYPAVASYRPPSVSANGLMYMSMDYGTCYAYSAGLNTWTAQPNKPTGVSNITGGAVIGQWVFWAGGMTVASAASTVHEALNVYTYPHNVGATAIIIPASGSQIAGGTPVTPQANVKNLGSNTETFTATYTFSMGGSQVYSQNATATNLAAGAVQTLSFPSFTPAPGTPYTTKAWTNLAGDQLATDDTCRGTFNTFFLPRTVLVQDFTAQWCSYCPYVQNALQQLKAETKDSLWVMGVHANNSNDSFYTQHSLDIQSFYGSGFVSGYPTTVWDGKDIITGGSTSSYANARSRFNTNKAVKAPFTVALTGTRTPDGSSGNIRATISYPGGAPITAKITMAIIEESKYCVWPSATANPKCDSMGDFVRDMFPASLGDAINIPAGKGTVVKDIPFTNAAGWNKPRLDYIVWVYDPTTKAAYNCGGISYAALSPLGVELSEFTATSVNGAITLNWRTGSETDNYQWLIERSTHPDNGFCTIAVIDASNNPSGHFYSFSDNNAAPLTDYYYRLGDKDINGNITWNGPVLVTSKGEVITSISLSPCSPNPCSNGASIAYALPRAGTVSLNVYDVSGRLARTLDSGVKNAGNHQVAWDLRDNSGQAVANGVYLYRLISGNFQSTQKLTVLK
jgi:thiol-disulfide isomerase/thioredoxin